MHIDEKMIHWSKFDSEMFKNNIAQKVLKNKKVSPILNLLKKNGIYFERGESTVIGSRPCLGKTSFSLNLLNEFKLLSFKALYTTSANNTYVREKIFNKISNEELNILDFELFAKNLLSYANNFQGIEFNKLVEKHNLDKFDLLIIDDFNYLASLFKSLGYEDNNIDTHELLLVMLTRLSRLGYFHIIIVSQLDREADTIQNFSLKLNSLAFDYRFLWCTTQTILITRDNYYSKDKCDCDDMYLNVFPNNADKEKSIFKVKFRCSLQKIECLENGESLCKNLRT